jgi:hypothetical protein
MKSTEPKRHETTLHQRRYDLKAEDEKLAKLKKTLELKISSPKPVEAA